jgi:hypothetical protein
MGRFCEEYDEKVCKRVRKKLVSWEEQQEERCKEYPWYDPRGWVCWLVTVVIKVVRWVTTVVCQIVTVTICLIEEVASSVTNVGTFIADGLQWIWGAITQVFFWILCRIFGRSLLKTVDICVVVFKNPTPTDPNAYTATQAEVERDVSNADSLWLEECNVHIKWDRRLIQIDNQSLAVAQFECPVDFGGVASGTINSQIWAYRNLASSLSSDGCKRLGWIVVVPISTPKLFVFYVADFAIQGPNGTAGCHLPPYPFVITTPGGRTLAHEIGHALSLTHGGGRGNLMSTGLGAVGTNLSNNQCCWARGSRFASFFGSEGVVEARRPSQPTIVGALMASLAVLFCIGVIGRLIVSKLR